MLNCSSEVTLMWITKIMEHAKLAKLGKVQFYKMLQIYSCKCITANEVIMMGARVGSWKDCNLEWRMDGNCAFLPIFGACFSPWVAAQSSAGTNKRKNNINWTWRLFFICFGTVAEILTVLFVGSEIWQLGLFSWELNIPKLLVVEGC